ncbi:hypothetical protein [Glaciibacter sp. 2TAF33]|uniref:hypothetical protein n=1 Tax=Glaciibacter sp. 2TAF33 TaxID=3233015 RepID=UPI003F92030D
MSTGIQTKVVEILMSAISVRALLAGKIVGDTVMAFAQIVAIGILVSLGMAVTGQRALLGDVGASIAWFAVFLLFGFVLLAAPYAATASMVSRQEDVGSVTAAVFLGAAAWWEPVVSLVILLAATLLVTLLGSRIYSNSLLRMGACVSFRDAIHG